MNFIVFDEFVILLDLYIYESRENKKFLQIQILYRYAISFENKFVTRENFSYPASRKGTKRSQKSFHFKFPNSPFASYPDLVPLFSKKKKKRRERDSIKFSYRSRRSSGHARRFIATCGRNPLGISRYSRGKMWSKTGHENSLAAENMGNDIVNEARTRQQKPPSFPAKTNKIGRFQHRRRQE